MCGLHELRKGIGGSEAVTGSGSERPIETDAAVCRDGNDIK